MSFDPEHVGRVIAFQEAQQRRNLMGSMALHDATILPVHAAGSKSGAGKVFHTKAHKRQKNEKYYTPPWVTRCLLRQVVFEHGIDEPAAGNGAIAKVLVDGYGYDVTAEDIAPDVEWIGQANFLSTVTSRRHNIVTNPPFGTGGRLAFQFCHHALRMTQPHGGKVAMLLRDDFDSAKGRRSLFRDHPAYDRKIVITDRIRWTNLPQSDKHGPSGSHAWFVWDWARANDWPIVQYEQADVDLKDKEAWKL